MQLKKNNEISVKIANITLCSNFILKNIMLYRTNLDHFQKFNLQRSNYNNLQNRIKHI